jgi:hypothetical protein
MTHIVNNLLFFMKLCYSDIVHCFQYKSNYLIEKIHSSMSVQLSLNFHIFFQA